MGRPLAGVGLALGLVGCAGDWRAPPLRVHLLSAPAGHPLDGAGSIDETELGERLAAVNDVFAPVGVEWTVESVVVTEARRVDQTTAAIEAGKAGMATLMAAIPEPALLSPDGWDLVVVGETADFGFGGVFTCGVGGKGGPAAAVVPVRSGAGGPQDLRKWAHELGHAVSLGHTPCTERYRDNLMMSGKCERADPERTGFTAAQREELERRLRRGHPIRTCG
jgi:hypothetical protein